MSPRQIVRRLVKSALIGILGEGSPHRILGGLGRGLFVDLDPAADLSILFGLREPELQRVMKAVLRPGDTVWDVGANQGFFTLMAARLVGPEGRVYAFEPIDTTAAKLKKNIELNGFSNVRIFNIALSASDGVVTFRVPEGGGNHSMASMVWHKQDPYARELPVRSVRVDNDEELKTLSPRFIKIDVEGAEALVVAGMPDLIKRARPVVFLECSERGRGETWRCLHEWKYRCYTPRNVPVRNFESYRHADFLWVPNPRHDR